MRTGRPRTPIGTHGAINTRRDGRRVVAETRVLDLDGRLHQVRARPRRGTPRPDRSADPRKDLSVLVNRYIRPLEALASTSRRDLGL